MSDYHLQVLRLQALLASKVCCVLRVCPHFMNPDLFSETRRLQHPTACVLPVSKRCQSTM